MVKKLKQNNLKESTNTYYWEINWGGVWNHGQKICYSEVELREFLATHVFDTMPQILCIRNESDKWNKQLEIRTSNNTNLSSKGRKDIFDKGITTLDKDN